MSFGTPSITNDFESMFVVPGMSGPSSSALAPPPAHPANPFRILTTSTAPPPVSSFPTSLLAPSVIRRHGAELPSDSDPPPALRPRLQSERSDDLDTPPMLVRQRAVAFETPVIHRQAAGEPYEPSPVDRILETLRAVSSTRYPALLIEHTFRGLHVQLKDYSDSYGDVYGDCARVLLVAVNNRETLTTECLRTIARGVLAQLSDA